MKPLSVVNKKIVFEKKSPRYGDHARPYDAAPDVSTPKGRIEASILDALAGVYDPELPVDIVQLGLIYGIDVDENGEVKIRMTLTAPNCPVAQSMPEEVREKAAAAKGVVSATMEVIWDPPWNPGMMTEAARLECNL
ncbi:MAG: DUF59 domain-containing protein [Deltaproteobacteria bacterium]|nr:DUF59 domain-containing protein [Deltaproteobacteria bacterium]